MIPVDCAAAILSMKSRYNKLKDHDPDRAEEFLLNSGNKDSDFGENSKVLNPTIESTYNFIDFIFNSMKTMHKDIQPLKIIYERTLKVMQNWTNGLIYHYLNHSN